MSLIQNLLFLIVMQLILVDTHVYRIDVSRGLGRRFDGIGAISGGGATSKLLVSYPQKQRDEVFDYLFKPNFGAALHLLKVEIGGDMQSTDGSEATHMRSPDEENYMRGYEWWFMKEAKKRNQDLQLIGLPWGWPGWLAGTTGDVFANPEQTAMYVVKWILGAKSHHDLHIDYVGIWNESRYTPKYIKVLRQMLNNNGLNRTLIIAADRWDWNEISSQVLTDPELADAIYAIGCHYSATNSSLLALDTGKQLWASEDRSTYLDLHWNLNYVDGYMSGTVMWPVLSAYYKGLPWEGVGLLNASEPWSGHYDVPVFLYLAAHTTQFTRPGWTFLKHGSGVGRFTNGGIYVSLISPDGKDLTIVIETLYSNETKIPVSPENITLQLDGQFAAITELNVWFTQLHPDNLSTSTVFNKMPPVQITDGRVNLDLGINQVWTLTTLTTGDKGVYPDPPTSQRFPIPYSDNFESYNEYEEPYFVSPQTGAYEVTTVGGSHGKVMRQMTWMKPVTWSVWCHMESADLTLAVMGDYYWSDVFIESEVFINETWSHPSTGVYLAARVDHGGCRGNNNTGLYFYVFLQEKIYIVSKDIVRNNVLSTGTLDSVNAGWNKISLSVKGRVGIGELNDVQIFNVTVPDIVISGFAALGTSSYGAADFDNLFITGFH